MRILHCPTSVGGNAFALSSAEKKIGLDSTVMILQNNWLGFKTDINLRVNEMSRLKRNLIMWKFFINAIRKYDIFHFNYGRSLISYDILRLFHIDIPILKFFNKGIVVTYQGSDARQIDYCVKNYKITPFKEDDIVKKQDITKRRRIKKFSKYADKVYTTNPDLLNVLEPGAEFRPYTKLNINKWKSSFYSDYKKEKLIVAHAPTRRNIKGTEYIISAINKLKNEHYSIELLLIENIPNNKVKEIYIKADIFIDQLLIGWYGGAAVEFMALNKPVIAYIREEDMKYIPAEMFKDMPIINSAPDKIYDTLKYCYDNRDFLIKKSIDSRKYVEKWHNPVTQAEKLKTVYENILADKKVK
jgi:hypothetical protein